MGIDQRTWNLGFVGLESDEMSNKWQIIRIAMAANLEGMTTVAWEKWGGSIGTHNKRDKQVKKITQKRGKTEKENEVSREVHDNEIQYWPWQHY